MTTKKQFLSEHNELAPSSLQASIATLTRFRLEKPRLFKEGGWSIEKLRRPFIIWLTSLTAAQKQAIKNEQATESNCPSKN